MTAPTHQDDERADESRDISDVGLPRPGDATVEDARTRDVDEAALDEVFPAEES